MHFKTKYEKLRKLKKVEKDNMMRDTNEMEL